MIQISIDDKAKQDPELLTYTDECVRFGEGAVQEYSKQQFSPRRGYPRSPERGSRQELRLACPESTMDESRAAITRVHLSEGASGQAWFDNDASEQAWFNFFHASLCMSASNGFQEAGITCYILLENPPVGGGEKRK